MGSPMIYKKSFSELFFIRMESSHSGLVRTLGKRVWGNPPGVRISYSPPKLLIIFSPCLSCSLLFYPHYSLLSPCKLTLMQERHAILRDFLHSCITILESILMIKKQMIYQFLQKSSKHKSDSFHKNDTEV